MDATIIDGAGIAAVIKNNLKAQIDALNYPLHIAAVCVGDDRGIRAFVAVKQKAARTLGVEFSSYLLDGESVQEAEDALSLLAADDKVHGIFVELPLPPGWDRERLLSRIPPEKDVDALTVAPLVTAPAVRALQYVIDEHSVNIRGIHAAVVGNGFLVGEPIARWLREQGAVVEVIDIDTPEPERLCSGADLVIAGAGKPGLVTSDWVKDGATVIDFGYSRSTHSTKHQGGEPVEPTSSGQAKYVGDVDFSSVKKKAGLLTPVPGGMGPLVVAAVLENLVELATR